MRRTIFAALLAGVLGCTAELGAVVDGDRSTCDLGADCPDSGICFNGLCTASCSTAADCEDGEYCASDGLCHPGEVATCPEVACPEGQVCSDGFCVPPPDGPCNPENILDDGCPSHEICIDVSDDIDVVEGVCHAFPACPADGVCPVGLVGAVCNDGALPEKDQLCLVGYCRGPEHCPANWHCVETGVVALGVCGSGAIGQPCLTPDHCVSGNCLAALPGIPGLCL